MRLRQVIKRPAYIFMFVILLVGVVLIIVEFDQFVKAIQEADWHAIPGALLFTVVSYTCMSFAFALVCQMFNIPMRIRDMAEIGYITNSINHIVSSAGIAGFSLRYILMRPYGVVLNDVLGASIMHFYLTSLDMLIMLPVGLTFLVQNSTISQGIVVVLSVMTALFVVLALVATMIIFTPEWRKPILNLAGKITTFFTRKDLLPSFNHFDETMTRGIKVMREQPRRLLSVVLLTAVDWIASVIVLSFCLDAFGPHQSFGVVMTGFVIGMMIGVASMVPGGLGVQEGSMTGIFMLLGVSFGQAVLAVILFRGIFFFLPYLVSLLFYRRLLRVEGSPAS